MEHHCGERVKANSCKEAEIRRNSRKHAVGSRDHDAKLMHIIKVDLPTLLDQRRVVVMSVEMYTTD